MSAPEGGRDITDRLFDRLSTLTSKHLVFPQPAEAEVLPQPCLVGRTSFSVWWLQIEWTLRPRV